jgi:catechol 2,3-dioxygenase-like lactoylglutathione lyase family enzyme
MLDHVTIYVRNFAACEHFYVAALLPLGYAEEARFSADVTGIGDVIGYGPPGRPRFWIVPASAEHAASGPFHVAFTATSDDDVNAFYRAAIDAGGRDNGAPGPRPQYRPDYYGAFVFDPDGNNVEAVCLGGA